MYSNNVCCFFQAKPKRKKSGKNKKGKNGNTRAGKDDSNEITLEKLLSRPVMLNVYYTCHNAADFLAIRPVEYVPRAKRKTSVQTIYC